MKFVETIKLGLHHTESGHPTSEGKEYKNRRYDNSKKLTSKEARLFNVGIFNHKPSTWCFIKVLPFWKYSLYFFDLHLPNARVQKRRWQPTPVLLPGKSHGRRSLVSYSPWGPEESDTTEWLQFPFSLSCIGEGNGNPLQCCCLENPRDGGAWWAAVYGVAQGRIRPKRLGSSSTRVSLMQLPQFNRSHSAHLTCPISGWVPSAPPQALRFPKATAYVLLPCSLVCSPPRLLRHPFCWQTFSILPALCSCSIPIPFPFLFLPAKPSVVWGQEPPPPIFVCQGPSIQEVPLLRHVATQPRSADKM